jgi:hypothetical protein
VTSGLVYGRVYNKLPNGGVKTVHEERRWGEVYMPGDAEWGWWVRYSMYQYNSIPIQTRLPANKMHLILGNLVCYMNMDYNPYGL